MQPVHVELSPSHTPHSSSIALPLHTPLQSNSVPSGHSAQFSKSSTPPPHTPQTSFIALPPHTPLQSTTAVQFPLQSTLSDSG